MDSRQVWPQARAAAQQPNNLQAAPVTSTKAHPAMPPGN
jgi:hypothetical protein